MLFVSHQGGYVFTAVCCAFVGWLVGLSAGSWPTKDPTFCVDLYKGDGSRTLFLPVFNVAGWGDILHFDLFLME